MLGFVAKMMIEIASMLFFIRAARINFYPEQYYSDLDKELMKSFRRVLGKTDNLPPLRPNRFAGCMMIAAASFIGLFVLLDLFFVFRYLVTGHF